jgi:hypothetical protein
MTLLCFDVFGRILGVRRERTSWRVYTVGADGKLGNAGVAIPEFIDESELGQYLADIFHENARPGMSDVRRIP